MNPKRKSYLINMAVGLVMGIVTFLVNSQDSDILIRRLCDSFFVPGVMLLGYGGLVFCRNKGTFDVMTYGVKSVFHTHVPGASIGNAREETFREYQDRKTAKRKSPAGSLWAGLTYLVLAIAALVLFYVL